MDEAADSSLRLHSHVTALPYHLVHGYDNRDSIIMKIWKSAGPTIFDHPIISDILISTYTRPLDTCNERKSFLSALPDKPHSTFTHRALAPLWRPTEILSPWKSGGLRGYPVVTRRFLSSSPKCFKYIPRNEFFSPIVRQPLPLNSSKDDTCVLFNKSWTSLGELETSSLAVKKI